MNSKAFLVLCTVSAAIAVVSSIEIAPLYAMDSPAIIEGEYIVVFREDITDQEISDHLSILKGHMERHPGNISKSEIMFEYNIGDFHGYSVRMSDRVRDIVRSVEKVKYIEANQKVSSDKVNFMEKQQFTETNEKAPTQGEVVCYVQSFATWGITRTSFQYQPEPLYYKFEYPEGSGADVDVYIIDTGIDVTHPDFDGRAIWGKDLVDNSETDPNGHGTHVAGTVMSYTYGVAKSATAIAVRVLDASGSGSYSKVIEGIEYAASQGQGKKSIANMSLGGPKSTALNNAVDAAVADGVAFVAAAGNAKDDACYYSPASASEAFTVAASDATDQFATWFSNYGSCVDIVAPGVSITSTLPNASVGVLSGTSMAAPHVAGVMAKFLSSGSYTPQQLKTAVLNAATQGVLTSVPSSTTNLLLYKGCP